MKLITVDDFLTWHNNAGGFLSCPVIVQLDNDPPNGRELSMYFFSCLEGGAKSGMYDYWVRNAARKQDLTFNFGSDLTSESGVMHRVIPFCVLDGLNLSTNLRVTRCEFAFHSAIDLLWDIRGFT